MSGKFWFIFIAVVIIGSYFLIGGLGPEIPEPTISPIIGVPISITPDLKKDSLQLNTIPFTQAELPKCELEGPKVNCECTHIPYADNIPEITCSNTNNCQLWQACVQANWPETTILITDLGGQPLPADRPFNLDCNHWLKPKLSDGREYCLAKPVIYLYPKQPTYIDVTIKTPGRFLVSIPHYPDGGWKNVYAFPDGKLLYQNKIYSELFYETDVKNVKEPKNGLIFKRENLRIDLSNVLVKIGLNKIESREFLEYWMPTLEKLNSPYILFSLVEKDEKERIDKIVVNPKPDTRIEFLAYFKPLDKLISLPQLVLPDNPPQRIGFTEVEWGGTIAK